MDNPQEQLKYLLQGLKNYNTNKMYAIISEMSEVSLQLFEAKDKNYNGSWQQDGEIGAFLNLKRKIDRLLNFWKNGRIFNLSDDETGETVLDTYMDLVNYALLNMALMFLKCKTQEEFDIFARTFPFLKEHFEFDERISENRQSNCSYII